MSLRCLLSQAVRPSVIWNNYSIGYVEREREGNDAGKCSRKEYSRKQQRPTSGVIWHIFIVKYHFSSCTAQQHSQGNGLIFRHDLIKHPAAGVQEEFAVIRLLTDFSRISETRVANRSIPCELLDFLTHLHVYPFQRCFDVFLFAFFLYIYKETLGFIQNVLHNKQLRYNLVLQAACLVIFVSTPPHFFQVSSSQDAL